MTYVDEVYGDVRRAMPDIDDDMARLYALLALTTGEYTTNENVHDAWSIWVNDLEHDHRSLVPFRELPREVRELDREYTDAIRAVARHLHGGSRRLLPYQRTNRR